MSRISQDAYFMGIVDRVKERSTCLRRQGGCVLIDDHHAIMATGYNGPPRGFPHCTICARNGIDSGAALEKCMAIHAEANALLYCPDIFKINTCYTTFLPCRPCLQLILNTACKRIVFKHKYGEPDHFRFVSEVCWDRKVKLVMQPCIK